MQLLQHSRNTSSIYARRCQSQLVPPRNPTITEIDLSSHIRCKAIVFGVSRPSIVTFAVAARLAVTPEIAEARKKKLLLLCIVAHSMPQYLFSPIFDLWQLDRYLLRLQHALHLCVCIEALNAIICFGLKHCNSMRGCMPWLCFLSWSWRQF